MQCPGWQLSCDRGLNPEPRLSLPSETGRREGPWAPGRGGERWLQGAGLSTCWWSGPPVTLGVTLGRLATAVLCVGRPRSWGLAGREAGRQLTSGALVTDASLSPAGSQADGAPLLVHPRAPHGTSLELRGDLASTPGPAAASCRADNSHSHVSMSWGHSATTLPPFGDGWGQRALPLPPGGNPLRHGWVTPRFVSLEAARPGLEPRTAASCRLPDAGPQSKFTLNSTPSRCPSSRGRQVRQRHKDAVRCRPPVRQL